jgi:hypothetical protein
MPRNRRVWLAKRSVAHAVMGLAETAGVAVIAVVLARKGGAKSANGGDGAMGEIGADRMVMKAPADKVWRVT